MEINRLLYKSNSCNQSHTLCVWSEMHTRIIITFIPLNYLLKGTLSELSPPKRKSLSSPMGVRVCQERSRGFSPLILILGQTKKQKTPKIFKQRWKLILIWQENFSLSKNHLWVFTPVKNQIKYSNKLQLIEIKLDYKIPLLQGKWF